MNPEKTMFSEEMIGGLIVRQLFPSGAWQVTDLIDGHWETRTYYGYTKRESIAEFKKEFGLGRRKKNPDEGYHGWENYETWNVALWIGNDEGLYHMARESKSYKDFVDSLREFGGEIAYQTPDGVAWNDSGLDIEELDELIAEL